jgi:hypothetical protein
MVLDNPFETVIDKLLLNYRWIGRSRFIISCNCITILFTVILVPLEWDLCSPLLYAIALHTILAATAMLVCVSLLIWRKPSPCFMMFGFRAEWPMQAELRTLSDSTTSMHRLNRYKSYLTAKQRTRLLGVENHPNYTVLIELWIVWYSEHIEYSIFSHIFYHHFIALVKF